MAGLFSVTDRKKELIAPYLMAVSALVIWHQSGLSLPKDKDVVTPVLGLAGVFVGFLATSKAILITLDNQLIKDLRRSGHMAYLVRDTGEAIWTNLILCCLCTLLFFVDQQFWLWGHLWVFSTTLAFSCFVRLAYVMMLIFKHSQLNHKDSRKPPTP